MPQLFCCNFLDKSGFEIIRLQLLKCPLFYPYIHEYMYNNWHLCAYKWLPRLHFKKVLHFLLENDGIEYKWKPDELPQTKWYKWRYFEAINIFYFRAVYVLQMSTQVATLGCGSQKFQSNSLKKTVMGKHFGWVYLNIRNKRLLMFLI